MFFLKYIIGLTLILLGWLLVKVIAQRYYHKAFQELPPPQIKLWKERHAWPDEKAKQIIEDNIILGYPEFWGNWQKYRIWGLVGLIFIVAGAVIPSIALLM